MRGAAALKPVVIAGGGPAGASAACLLAMAGRPATVLERFAGPQHKICGEFLSGEAVAMLRRLRVDPAGQGAAPITAVRLVHGLRVAESRLPFQAAGWSRLALDEALLQRAAALGAEVHRGIRVRAAGPRSVETAAGAVDGAAVLLATGKHDLRGISRRMARPPLPLIGLKIHLRLAPAQVGALRGFVELVAFEGGYAGLQMIERGEANLCVLVDCARYPGGAPRWDGLQALMAECSPHLARRLEGAAPCFERPLTISHVPYGYLHEAGDAPSPYRLGDQAAVIPSFCGDGMAIALRSGWLAAEAVLQGGDAASYHRQMRAEAGPPVRLACGLHRFMADRRRRLLMVEAARLWPGLLRLMARQTRVSLAFG